MRQPPETPYRIIYVGLGLLVVGAVALGIAFGGGGETAPLPPPVESVSPLAHATALAQAVLEIDLEPGFQAEIFVDGFPVPASEVIFVEATGVHRWQPAANSLVFDRWAPGAHTIRIAWDTLTGLPQPGEYTWTFRTQ
ncbi:MAG: hypothetical protein ACRDWH_03220 [Acidimicrobiia bacterium]